jgi:phospholipase C
MPGSGGEPASAQRPDPGRPAGTDLLAEIRHIVVLMMENHSYDSYLGMLQGRGDGLARNARGLPTASNPGQGGAAVPELHAPGPVQVASTPTRAGTPATSSGARAAATGSCAASR